LCRHGGIRSEIKPLDRAGAGNPGPVYEAAMKDYHFIQGLLIGVCLWGVCSAGLRYVHYAWETPIPKVLLAPGRILAPIKPPASVYSKPLEDFKVAGPPSTIKIEEPPKTRWYATQNFDLEKYLEGGKQKLQLTTEKVETSFWKTLQEFVAFVANVMTIFVPIFSGILSVVIWRRQKFLESRA
jgi:hypothetical protein